MAGGDHHRVVVPADPGRRRRGCACKIPPGDLDQVVAGLPYLTTLLTAAQTSHALVVGEGPGAPVINALRPACPQPLVFR